ncbi:MAG TPA: matrixin family metalloprotease [Thermoanaerobaculia bacterium]|nr:matrixin family metalloprotease [Thermoanaerobaculia bacterium]
MTKLSTKTLVLAAALVLVVASVASAYVLLSPARTWDSPPTYIIDSRGLPDVNDGDGGATRVRNAIVSSSAWNGSGAGTVVNATLGSMNGFSLGDGTPMLNFRDPQGACGGSCLAATFTGFYNQRSNGTYRIYDADIVTNYSGHNWTSQGEDPNGSGCSGEIYVEGVQVHEIGHGLGLGHTNVSGATMYPSVSGCNNGPASTASDDNLAIVALYGGGTNPPPGGGCSGTTYTGSLSGRGDSEVEPNGNYYYTGSTTHTACLTGPSGTDFDLYLRKWNGWSWVNVASSLTSSSSESITYNGTSGYYYWLVYSYSGSGSYTLVADW